MWKNTRKLYYIAVCFSFVFPLFFLIQYLQHTKSLTIMMVTPSYYDGDFIQLRGPPQNNEIGTISYKSLQASEQEGASKQVICWCSGKHHRTEMGKHLPIFAGISPRSLWININGNIILILSQNQPKLYLILRTSINGMAELWKKWYLILDLHLVRIKAIWI